MFLIDPKQIAEGFRKYYAILYEPKSDTAIVQPTANQMNAFMLPLKLLSTSPYQLSSQWFTLYYITLNVLRII